MNLPCTMPPLPARALPLTPQTLFWDACKVAIKHYEPQQGEFRRHDFKRLLKEMVKVIGNRPIVEITREDIARLIEFYVKRGRSQTIGTYLLTASMVFRLAVDDGVLAQNPVNKRRLSIPPKREYKAYPFTWDQFQAILTESTNTRLYGSEWSTAIIIGYYTGLRISDTVRLRWDPIDRIGESYVDLEHELIHLRQLKRRERDRRIEMPMDGELLLHLQKILPVRDTLLPYITPFLATQYDGGLERGHLSTDFRRMADAVGLPEHSFHSFRHGFVSRLVNAGVNPKIISEMTGQNVLTIHKYTHVNQEAKIQALRLAGREIHEQRLRSLGFVPEQKNESCSPTKSV